MSKLDQSEEAFYDKRELAARYKVTTRTIENWVARKKFPKPTRLSYKIVLWAADKVHAWENKR